MSQFNISISHESDDLIGGVNFNASDLFSAYRLTWAYIQMEGRAWSDFRIECNGEQMTCRKTISQDAIKGFIQS